MPTHDMGGWVFYTPKPNKIVVQEDEDWGSILNDLTGVITGWRSRIWLALCCPGLRDSSFLQGDF